MDVNGTRFHLFGEKRDWRRCCETELCPDKARAGDPWTRVFWDRSSGCVTLRPHLSLFRHRQAAALDVRARRGAARDRFGNWYWIGADRRTIYCLTEHTRRPIVFWAQEPGDCPPLPDAFGPVPEPRPLVELAGLTVTEHHYLVVGNVTEGGLFLFDLHAGDGPTRLLFPEEEAFEPFDMAPAPGGGVWILDRKRGAYWGLDRYFRSLASSPATDAEAGGPGFSPVEGEPPGALTSPPLGRQRPRPFPLTVHDAVGIEGLPDGSVLILDRPALPPGAGAPSPSSVLWRYRLGHRELGPVPLAADLEVVVEGEDAPRPSLPVIGYDLAFVPAGPGGTGAGPRGTLYVVEREGNQAIAFDLDFEVSPPQVRVTDDYLPMHFFGSRALVVSGGEAFYDVVGGDPTNDAAVRWVAAHRIDAPRYEREGMLFTFPLDGKERGCVWHRLFLDACIPADAAVEVWTRAHDDAALLPSLPFVQEPDPYRRDSGAEVPFYEPFPVGDPLRPEPGLADPEAVPLPEGLGTWELLFQEARGRFLQIRLVLRGNGRVTPFLRALRAYYPRFSYPRHYLPAVYLEDAESAHFLDRLLANPEGIYTEIEGKISEVSALFDARSAPAETLDWLAGWMGLVVDPLWGRIQQQRARSQGAGAAADDRRRLFIRFARRLYRMRGTPDGIQSALHLLLDPCLEGTLRRLKTAAVRPGTPLCDELRRLHLECPTPATGDQELEDLLFDYLLAPQRPTSVRLVERFRTRNGRAVLAGDPTEPAELLSSQPAPVPADPIAQTAHSFSVLIPESLSADEEAMVRRIVELEKPAHTFFDIRRYWDYLRVGETRLGIDTTLGEDSRFVAVTLGQTPLGAGYLYPAPPMDAQERVFSDRDRLGRMPSL